MDCLLILLIIIVFIIVILMMGIRSVSLIGGRKRGGKSSPITDDACTIYIKMQKIAQTMSEDQMAKTHSTWGESFFFGYINNLFLNGWDNTNKYFPLVPDYDMIYKTLKDVAYWNEMGDESVTAKKILDIIESDNVSQADKNKIVSLIPESSIKILEDQYPKVSKEHIKALIIRYGSAERNPDLTDTIKLSSAYLSLPPPVYNYISTSFKKCVECFASPINHTLDTYCAIFKSDEQFGAIGPFSQSTLNKDTEAYYIANPPYDRVSLHLASKVAVDSPNNYTSLLFPCKDGGQFHFYGKRFLKKLDYYPHSRLKIGEQKMNESIKNAISTDHFSGMVIIPRELMRYWNYGRRETKVITYDTIIMFSFKGNTSPIFYTLLEQILWRILLYGYSDNLKWIKYHGFPKKIIELDNLKKEYFDSYSKETAEKLFKSSEVMYKIIDEYRDILTNDRGTKKMMEKLIDKKLEYELM